MVRKKRMESIGFHHIVNRSVERRKIYMDDNDSMQFLEILQLEGINLKLFSVALLYTDDIEDDSIEYLEPVEVLTKEEIRAFFEMRLNR